MSFEQTSQTLELAPSDLVGIINQQFESLLGRFVLVGELSNFRISKNKWVYFDVKDDHAKVACFGTVFQLPGPLEDGMLVSVAGEARLHPQFGFSVSVAQIQPKGEGTIKKAIDLLTAKLTKEGLFDPARKRSLPPIPERIGLVTAHGSAAYHDFVKILNERWGGVHVYLTDVLVQGISAPAQIVQALTHLNQLVEPLDVIVVTRGGGSADDLAAFNDERVVRALAASRVPTLVAIGHEVDISLAELAADQRASTPSNAVQVLVPDKRYVSAELDAVWKRTTVQLQSRLDQHIKTLHDTRSAISTSINQRIEGYLLQLASTAKIVDALSPQAALQRGYALIRKGDYIVAGVDNLAPGDELLIELRDGIITSNVKEVNQHAKSG